MERSVNAGQLFDITKKYQPQFRFEDANCKCEHNMCQCCFSVHENHYRLHEKLCVEMAYLSEESGVKVEFSITGTITYTMPYEWFLRNLTTIFLPRFKLPRPDMTISNIFFTYWLDIEVHFCIKLYVIKATNGTVKGCVGFQIRFLNLYDYQLDLFCTTMVQREVRNVPKPI
ncbi:uncharacterized protein LOC142340798 isoform X2 [Convolutriloba macropyga]|uniref:uncharacterized protein LOC142340798 isoform X2 n=1 Tax=Convolutriloba macropyga TaxID=536237 RepID=UPI003F52726B